MAKVLRVIQPFLVMELGETFEYNEETGMYVADHVEEFHKADDINSDLRSVFSSHFAISKEYAKELLDEDYLEEVVEKPTTEKRFTNVFDEIDRLIEKYTDELDNLDEDMASLPECVKVERTTVLNNILSVLEHLRALKK